MDLPFFLKNIKKFCFSYFFAANLDFGFVNCIFVSYKKGMLNKFCEKWISWGFCIIRGRGVVKFFLNKLFFLEMEK